MEFLTIAEVMSRTKLCKASIYKHARSGQFPKPAKIGAMARWSADEIERWMRERLDARAAA